MGRGGDAPRARAIAAVTRWLGAWPGRIETPGLVRRRMLLVALVAALAVTGVYAVARQGPEPSPFGEQELRDMSGLPVPPARFVEEDDGTYRELTPEELHRLQQLQELIRNFPAPRNLPPRLPPSPGGDDGGASGNGGG